LRQELQAYKFFQKQLEACDKEIENFISEELKKIAGKKEI
jgi:hypothetical protein